MTPGELRARLRPLASNERDRFCGVKEASLYPSIVVKQTREGAKAKFSGVMLCGHIWSCPTCSRVLRAKRAVRIEAAVKGAGGTWGMLTGTVRHRAGGDLRRQLKGLMRALRRVKQGGAVQRIWGERVSMSVRTTEVTWGQHGWHPHVHLLVRSKKWTPKERDVLDRRWRDVVVDELGTEATPNAYGLHWSEPFDSDVAPSGYLTKLGLELSGAGKKGRAGGRTSWELAEDAVTGDAQSRRLWGEYTTATKGSQMIRLDSRASYEADKWIQLHPPDWSDTAPPPEDFKPLVPVEVELYPEEVRALRAGERKHPTLLDDVLRSAESADDPEAAVRDWVRWCTARDPALLSTHADETDVAAE